MHVCVSNIATFLVAEVPQPRTYKEVTDSWSPHHCPILLNPLPASMRSSTQHSSSSTWPLFPISFWQNWGIPPVWVNVATPIWVFLWSMVLACCPVGEPPIATPDWGSPTCSPEATIHQHARVSGPQMNDFAMLILDQHNQCVHLQTLFELSHSLIFTQKLRETYCK